MKDEVEPCRRVYFVAHAAELDKCPGELMVLYVMMTGRFVGLLGWPWFRREGEFLLFDFADLDPSFLCTFLSSYINLPLCTIEFLPAGRVEINGA